MFERDDSHTKVHITATNRSSTQREIPQQEAGFNWLLNNNRKNNSVYYNSADWEPHYKLRNVHMNQNKKNNMT